MKETIRSYLRIYCPLRTCFEICFYLNQVKTEIQSLNFKVYCNANLCWIETNFHKIFTFLTYILISNLMCIIS